MNKNVTANNVDEYILQFSDEIQILLQKLRLTIKTAAPKAQEIISYNMPAYKQNGMLVYFAAFKNHIGFYATPMANEAFKTQLANYKIGKGSVQFTFDKKLPLALISKMIKFKVAENQKKQLQKNAKQNNI